MASLSKIDHAILGLEKVHRCIKNAPLRSNKPKKPLFKGAAYKRAQNGYKFWFEDPLPPKSSKKPIGSKHNPMGLPNSLAAQRRIRQTAFIPPAKPSIYKN